VIAILYAVVPLFIWNFSPHVLTHSMPYFLEGGSDWGGGNVFAFTKLAYWVSMVAGAAATCSVSQSAETGRHRGLFGFILRNYGWHGLAAITLVLVWKMEGSTDVGDLWSLTAYLFAGAVVIVWTAREFEKRGSRAWRLIGCLAIGTLWGLVPIGRG